LAKQRVYSYGEKLKWVRQSHTIWFGRRPFLFRLVGIQLGDRFSGGFCLLRSVSELVRALFPFWNQPMRALQKEQREIKLAVHKICSVGFSLRLFAQVLTCARFGGF